LLSAGSSAMKIDGPGLRWSGSMTVPMSRLTLYRLLDAAAMGSDGGSGIERAVVYMQTAGSGSSGGLSGGGGGGGLETGRTPISSNGDGIFVASTPKSATPAKTDNHTNTSTPSTRPTALSLSTHSSSSEQS
jgi:hypothetical protein